MENQRVLDVVIHTTSPGIDPSRTPTGERFNLSADLWIGAISNDFSEKIFKACEPAGYNFDPVRQFGQLYSFVRENPPNKDDLRWDPDQRLQLCLALSRVVHPTSVSMKYAARIFITSQGSVCKVVPGPVSGLGSRAFVVDTQYDYLTKRNAEELKQLLEAFEKKPLKDPIARAMWYHDYAFRTYEIDLRWTLVSTGIEVLIHTDRYNTTRQFVKRAQKLSMAVGAGDMTKSEAEEMYESRSSLSHGQGLRGLTSQKMDLYKKMEDILRVTIRKSIVDESFRAFLSDPGKIRQSWPI